MVTVQDHKDNVQMIYRERYDKRSGGSILILVLWALVFLSLLTVVSGKIARQHIILSGNIEKRTELYALVSSGARVMLDLLASSEGKDIFSTEDLMNSLTTKETSFSAPVHLGNGSFSWGEREGVSEKEKCVRSFGLVDEGGKINVNFADIYTLTRLFTTPGGLDADSSKKLAANVIDWRDQNDTIHVGEKILGESAVYLKEGYAYAPRNKPLVCVEELLLVIGMTPEVFLKIRDHVTVFGNGKVNVNTASPDVLEAMGVSRNLADKIVLFREEKDAMEDSSKNNVFRSPKDLMSVIQEENKDDVREAETREIDNLLFGGNVSTKVEVVSFLCTGQLDRGGPEGKLLCTVDRSGRLLYWGYFMTSGVE